MVIKILWFGLAFMVAGCGKGLVTLDYLTPSEIDGIQIWLDADFYFSKGAVDGTDIFTTYSIGHEWPSEAGMGFPVFFRTGAASDPIFRTSLCPNNQPAIDFSGGSIAYYDNTSFKFTEPLTGVTIFTLLSNGTNVVQGHFGMTSNATSSYSTTDRYILFGQAASGFTSFYLNDGTGGTPAMIDFVTSTDFLGYQLWWSQAEGRMEVTEIAGQTTTSHTTNTSLNSFNPDSIFEIGRASWGNSVGQICEIIVYNRALSNEEMADVRQYLLNKYTSGS